MRSAVVAKSLTDLTRRRARTAFAVASLSLAVASLGVFAVEPMMDDVMQEEVASTRLADLTVETRPRSGLGQPGGPRAHSERRRG